jgi:hypothetical protein
VKAPGLMARRRSNSKRVWNSILDRRISKRDLAAQVATFDTRLTALSDAIADAYQAAGWAPPATLRGGGSTARQLRVVTSRETSEHGHAS